MTALIRRFAVTFLLAAALLSPGFALGDHHEAAEEALVVAEKSNLKGKVVSVDAATRIVGVEGEVVDELGFVEERDEQGSDRDVASAFDPYR